VGNNKTWPKPTGVAFMKDGGEILDLAVNHKHTKYAFRGGFRVMGVIALTRLLSKKLSANQLRVAMWLPVVSKENNVLMVTGKMAEDALGIERHAFSRILGTMIDLDIIKRGEVRGLYYINPAFAWQGSARAHKQAVADWYKEPSNVRVFKAS
jgi:Firmicute plasmid replication protein (RepL)